MQKDDILTLTPTVLSSFGKQTSMGVEGPQPCKVVYVHPQERFFVVEFTASRTGNPWRETFYLGRRNGERGVISCDL